MSYEQLWAPWRLSYVRGDDAPQETQADTRRPEDDCFLCRAVDESDDRRNLIVHRGRQTITILNRYPYNNGHLLVAPRAHKAGLDDLDGDEQREQVEVLGRMVRTLEKVIRADGFNVGLNLGRVAGAGLPGHLHWHIVPRWHGDTNFMPTLAGVKVIPQSLEALWELLNEHLSSAE